MNNREARVDFHGENSSASTLTRLAKVVGRFAHEPGSIGRGLELRLSSQNSVLQGSGLLQWAPNAVGFLASIHLQIDSTDRCEYSATSVDVFTHYFMS